MTRILRVLTLAAALSGAALTFAGPARAQSNANELMGVEQAAMESYHNLELDTARDLLESGIDSAEDAGVSGAALAKAYVSLGIVYCGGYNDVSRCRELFVKGLQQDSGVELDPTFSTPDIAAVFDQARSEVFGSAPRAQAGGAVEGNLLHTPAPEQLKQTGVPIYVEVPAGIAAQTLRVFYRSLGMSEPASADMSPVGSGWGYTVPCNDVFEPTVEYFVVAIDADGQQVGNAGTPRSPVVVPIVSSRSMAAPSLPGQAPPAQCGGVAAAAPVGGSAMGAVGGGSGGLGDTCRTSSDCSTGLTCDDNFCAVDDGGASDEDEDRERGPAPRWFVRAGGGIGLSLVKDGMPTANSPGASYFSDLVPAMGQPDPAALAARAADAGYNCDFSAGTVADCKAILAENGLFSSAAIRFEFGYFVTEKLSLAIVGRFQPGAPSGFLAGLRAGYLLGDAKERGFQPSLFAGFAAGRIQPELDIVPPAYDTAQGLLTTDAPYVESGIMNVHFGMHLGYRFIRNFGIYVSPEFDFMFPDFLFHMDLTGGVEIAF